MNTFVSVDPGATKGHGWASWFGGELSAVGFGCVPPYPAGRFLVIELPQTYGGRAAKGDANDLIAVAFSAGKVAADFTYYEIVKPRQWKGTIPKDMMLKRILATLTDAELVIVKAANVPKKNVNDTLDAIGIGLWKLGRL